MLIFKSFLEMLSNDFFGKFVKLYLSTQLKDLNSTIKTVNIEKKKLKSKTLAGVSATKKRDQSGDRGDGRGDMKRGRVI